jgi:asparagine synthase (glutamine-hydrolysing)
MSALAGIYNFTGIPADQKLISALGAALDPWGPDGGREAYMGSVGMAYRAFHTNCESRMEIQPAISSSGHLLTWDGRLDNREELISLLRDILTEDRTDAALVMRAYQKWGGEFLERLIGDFALALWDSVTQILYLARDPFGTRTLYYHTNKERIFWSSTLDPILNLAGVRVEIDEEYIADYLAHNIPDSARTNYKDIYPVKPGHVIIIQNRYLRMHRHWGPDVSSSIQYQNDEEYEAHFRQEFKDAVRRRLRTTGTVFAGLSGGLDSSSIVCMADRIMIDGEAEASGFETYTLLTRGTENADEGKYARYVNSYRGERCHYIHTDESTMKFKAPEEYFQATVSTGLCNQGVADSLLEILHSLDARVTLSGLGGDQVLWSENDPAPILSNLLCQGKFLQLHRELQKWGRELRRPYLKVLLREALLPLLPINVRARYESKVKPPECLSQDYIKRLRIRERSPLPDDPFGFRLPGDRIRIRKLMYIISYVASGDYRHIAPGPYQRLQNIEISYPFLHRPLVEFLLAIPFEQLLRMGETRSIQRRALKGIVPSKVLARRLKGSVHEASYLAFIREWKLIKPLFDDARVCARGYVDAAALQSALTLARHGSVAHIIHLSMIISLEIWLRSLEFRYGLIPKSAAYNQQSKHEMSELDMVRTAMQ